MLLFDVTRTWGWEGDDIFFGLRDSHGFFHGEVAFGEGDFVMGFFSRWG